MDKIIVSFGSGTNFADITHVKDLTWREYENLLVKKALETDDKSSRGWSIPASFNDEWRHGANFKARYCLTFDYDKITPFDVDLLQDAYAEVAHVEYTTHSHTENKPRWRFVFPLSRACDADEFQAVSRKVATWAGNTGIELTSGESHVTAQMSFLPCVRPGAAMEFHIVDGPRIDVDAILSAYENWRDRAQWPKRKSGDHAEHKDKAEDPRTKPGVIGAFCRAYTISAAIEKFDLPYTRTAIEGRWTYTEGSRPEGAVVYDEDTKLHSHHDTDPARGQHNAFDLVRLHRFAELDSALDMEGEPVPITERPSFKAMAALANDDAGLAAETLADLEFSDLGPAPVEAKDPAAPLVGPQIEIAFAGSRPVESAMDKVLDALRTAGPEIGLVVYGNRLVWAVEGSNRKGFDDREVTTMELRSVSGTSLPAIWSGRIGFYRSGKDKEGKTTKIRVDCPITLAQAAVTRTDRLQAIAVDRIALTPIYEQGRLYAERGYSRDHRAWLLAPAGCVVRGVSRADADAALARLEDWISEFPFDTTDDRDVALAALLTAAMRASLDHAPGFVVSKPDYGSGASTLCDLINVVLTGRPAAVISAGQGKIELDKHIDGALLAGLSSLVIDNVADGEAFNSQVLAQVLTQQSREVRALGRSDVSSVPCMQMVLVNGNNIRVVDDLARRFLRIHLDARCESPHKRAFKRPHLIAQAQRERAEILSDVYTIVAAYEAAGSPVVLSPLASFERWVSLVAAPLVWLGRSNAIGSQKKIESDDEKRVGLAGVMEAWDALFGERAVTVGEVLEDSFDGVETEKRRVLKEGLQEFAGERGTTGVSNKRLGKWLSAVKGRVLSERAFEEAGVSAGYKRWRLRRTKKEPSWLDD
jgi:hypothetical protein